MAQVIKITEHRTVDGVMAFGIAHLLYIYGFYTLFYQTISIWFYIIWIVLAIVLFYFIGYNKDLHMSIITSNFIYSLILTALFSLVFIFAVQPYIGLTFKILSLLGVILFLISDSVLAYNEFQKPIAHAAEIIAITYVISQILLQTIPFLSNIIT